MSDDVKNEFDDNEFIKDVIENAGSAILVVDEDTSICMINREFERISGYTKEEIVGRKKWTEFPVREDLEKMMEYHRARREDPDSAPDTYDARLVDREGRIRDFTVSVRMLPDSRMSVVSIMDISGHKDTQRELHKAKKRYEALFNHSFEIFFEMDMSGNILDANERGYSLLQIDKDQELPLPVTDILVEDDIPAAIENLQSVIEKGSSLDPVQFRLRDREGGRIWMEVIAVRIDHEARPSTILGVARDITDRKETEKALRESEERFSAIFQKSPDVFYMIDFSGRFLDANDQALRLLGYSRKEIASITVADIVDMEDIPRAVKSIGKILEHGADSRSNLFRLRTKGGSHVWVEVTGVRMDRDGEPYAMLGIGRDITWKKKAEKALREADERLHVSQKMEAVGRLAGGVAGDFSNVINVIMGHCNILLKEMQEDDPHHEDIGQIQQAAKRALMLTRQLLIFSDKQKKQSVVFDMNKIIDNLARMMQKLMGPGIELETVLSAPVAFVKGDPELMEQAVMNLALNARDTMPEGGKLTMQTQNMDLDEDSQHQHVGVKKGAYVFLSITDTGAGMNEETRAKIFDPFFSSREMGTGTGLGLSAVYGIVRKFGGQIWVSSTPGKGSTFNIYLPRSDEKPVEVDTVEPIPEACMGTETILVVESDGMLNMLMTRILGSCGYSVLNARDSSGALEIARNHAQDIHLIITDLILPDMNGQDLAEKVSGIHPETQVLYTAGEVEDRDHERLVTENSTVLIRKPFLPGELAEKARDVLDLRTLESGDGS